MIAFEIELNGQVIGLAGTEDLCVLTAIVTAVGKLGAQSEGATDHKTDYHAGLSVGGLTARVDASQDEHFDWLRQPVNPGDVVTIRILESPSADAPSAAKPARTGDVFKQQFESAKQFYLENREKFEGS
jgi:flagellar basal body L-ring protein FlgH